MVIGAHVRFAAPFHPAGAEWSIQDAFSWLAARGHDCRVLAMKGSTRQLVNGVRVYSQPTEDEVATHWSECDVMFTQLDALMDAQILAVEHQTPLVQYVHSAGQLERLGVQPGCSALVVFNSWNVRDSCEWWPGESMVLHPPVDAARVAAKPGRCVTLVNLSHNKGGMVWWRAAMDCPDVPFLGVMGVYEEQIVTPRGIPGSTAIPTPTGLEANMRVSAPVIDITSVLDATRVLLVASHSETYGRVAVEAMLSGIPVIATRTPGLEEACADAAVYLDDRMNPSEVARTVKRVHGKDWDACSQAALDRSVITQSRSRTQLQRLEEHLQAITSDPPVMRL